MLWNVENQAIVLIHDLLFPFSPVGMAVIIGLGAIVVMLLGRRDDVVTTGITTSVIMVSAGLGPASLAWTIPPLRLLDTVIGIVVAVGCWWIGKFLFVFHDLREKIWLMATSGAYSSLAKKPIGK